MGSIQETPRKRRRVEDGDISKGYESQNDSGDDIFETYQTVATVPVPRQPKTQQSSPWNSTQCITQSTQIIQNDRPRVCSSAEKQSIVQVTASSPARSGDLTSPVPTPKKPISLLASAMAPAGTAFRSPAGVVKAPVAPMFQELPVIDISDDDDGPVYQGESSGEESQALKADIKPSSFIIQAQKMSAQSGTERLKEITSKSMYNPSSATNSIPVRSSSSGIMANAYENARGRLKAQVPQNAPAKPMPPQVEAPVRDIDIMAIQDYQIRDKIKRMLKVLPDRTVLACRDALFRKKGNYEDALEYLASREELPTSIDLTLDDDHVSNRPREDVALKRPVAKQQIKAPVQKIQEKWSATQPQVKADNSLSLLSATPPQKPRRRLVQGRKDESSSTVAPPPKTSIRASTPRAITPESEDFDSGLGQETDNLELEGRVLKFFNTCSTSDLVDIASVPREIAELILSQRLYYSLDEVRVISAISSSKSAGKAKKMKPIGDKIVEKCLDMWNGYEAVDKLVNRCQELAQPLKDAMAKWGVDVYGSASKDGELEIVGMDMLSNRTRDSAIGTPTSRSMSVDVDEQESDAPKNSVTRRHGLFPQPANMQKHVSLKDYQIIGINWLSLLFEQRLSCILADDMGLGKTCQVIAFLAHLLEKGITGPHLIIVPGSTLENWLREFRVFCPELKVMPYYASQNERPGIQEQILNSPDTINVIVTTYNLAKMKDDNKFLRKLKPVCCVYDEGHMLKNSKSAGYGAYMRINAQFRLLLTGTPLQNNLRELVSLLGFILPKVFREHSEDLEAIFSHKAKTTDKDESHAALLSTQRIARAKSMMAPFVLRRKKHQVLKHLPMKHRKIEYCEMSQSQIGIYEQEKAKAVRVFAARSAGERTTNNESANIMMALRKASIHPLLFRRIYDDKRLRAMVKACLKESEFQDCNPDLVYEDMTVMDDIELHLFCERYPVTLSSFRLQKDEWMDSGKVKALGDLLHRYKDNGDKVLIFSQFVMVMNILELVMETLGTRFFRLDGSTPMDERQTMIDEFHDDPEITVFLLSTKAGGAGINLACANKVVIFDLSFNPQVSYPQS